ncbi:hypothetical protein [Estrella lausannensis]|uniref:Uncharacterized protein n=1 Tax=Estrella lausannensis TaxID=483423 RepID=A0A0H5DPW0_9BACT|nr:hypothetical protein [Estrella lausannensis]CRX38621.1 hypothetical protein ELAC_1281 [Estrella lausannensis]
MQAVGSGELCKFCLSWDREIKGQEAEDDALFQTNCEEALDRQNLETIVTSLSVAERSEFTWQIVSKIEGICNELLYKVVEHERRKKAITELSNTMQEVDAALSLNMCECDQLKEKKSDCEDEMRRLSQKVELLLGEIDERERLIKLCCLKQFALSHPDCASDSSAEFERELTPSGIDLVPMAKQIYEKAGGVYSSFWNWISARKNYVEQAASEGKKWGGALGAPKIGEAAGYMLGMIALSSGKSPDQNPLAVYAEYWQGVYSSNKIDASHGADNSSLFSPCQIQKMRNYFRNYLEDLDHSVMYAHAIKDFSSLGCLLSEHKKTYEAWGEIYLGSSGKSKEERCEVWVECLKARLEEIKQQERHCLEKLVKTAAFGILSPFEQIVLEGESGIVFSGKRAETTIRVERKVRRYVYRLNELKEIKRHLIQEMAGDRSQASFMDKGQNNPFLEREDELETLPGKPHTRLYEQLLYLPSDNIVPKLYCHVSSLLQNLVWRSNADLIHDHQGSCTLLHAMAERGSEKLLRAVLLAIEEKNQFLPVPTDKVQRWRLRHVLDYRFKRADGMDCFEVATREGNRMFLKSLIQLAMSELPASFPAIDFVKNLMKSPPEKFEGKMYTWGFGGDDIGDELSDEFGKFIIGLLSEEDEESFYSFSSSSSSAD